MKRLSLKLLLLILLSLPITSFAQVPVLPPVCIDIQLFPPFGSSAEMQCWSAYRAQRICQSVGCNLYNHRTREAISGNISCPSATRYNFQDLYCGGTHSANSCPAVQNYGLPGVQAENARRTVCQSFNSCTFQNGPDAGGVANSGINDSCTRSQVQVNFGPLVSSGGGASDNNNQSQTRMIIRKPECTDMSLLVGRGRSNRDNYELDVIENGICASVGCRLRTPHQSDLSRYNSRITYNPRENRCVGTETPANACPNVSLYFPNYGNDAAEGIRKRFCESFSGCVFHDGGNRTNGLPDGRGDRCTRGRVISASDPGSRPMRTEDTNPCAPPESLVAWLPADRNSLDIVGGHDGLLIGNAGYAPGRDGQAFSFQIENSYDDIPLIAIADPGLNSPLDLGGEDLTLMLWVKRLDETGNVYLLEKGYTYDDWYLKLLQNVPSFGVGNRGVVPSFGTVEAPAPETSRTVPRDRWTHLAGVKRGNTLTLYLNGSRSNSETFESLTRAPNDDYITMGSSSVPGFAGLIDDVALWNRALSETQIRNFKDGICRPNPSPPAPTSCIEAPGGLVAWWPGEENLEDIIGGHDEGTLEEGVTYVDGIVGKAIFKPTGVPAPMARIPGSDALNFENEYTLMAWVRAGEFGTGSVLARGNSYRMGSTGVSSETESGRSLGAGPPYRYRLPIDEWVHIAGVMSSQRSEFYINGTLAGASVFEMPPRLVQEEANSALALSGQRAFNEGSIDEPMIFNRALSQSEIRSIVRAGSYGVCRP